MSSGKNVSLCIETVFQTPSDRGGASDLRTTKCCGRCLGLRFQTPSDRGGASDTDGYATFFLFENKSFKPLLIGEVLRTAHIICCNRYCDLWFQTPSDRGGASDLTASLRRPVPFSICFKPLLIGEVLRTKKKRQITVDSRS